MARFCGFCGAPIDENASVCGNCGKPVDGEETKGGGRKKVNVMAIAVIAAMIIVLAALIFAITRLTQNDDGRQGLIKQVIKAYEKEDIDSMIRLSSDIYRGKRIDGLTAEEYFRNVMGSSADYYENAVGHNYKLTYKILDLYDMSQRRQNEYVNSIMELYPYFSASTITAMSAAEVEITAKRGSSMVTEYKKITMSKEDGNWKLADIE